MKKKKLTVGVVILMMLLFTGCTYKKNYIKTYEDELKTVFGEYEYKSLGKQDSYGYGGIGKHEYYSWEITYTDATGKKSTFVLRNDDNFDYAIKNVFRDNVVMQLEDSILADCIEAGSVNDTNCYISFFVDFDNYYFEEDDGLAGPDTSFINEDEYEHFNIANLDSEKLIKDGIVTIQQLDFRTRRSHDNPATDSEIAYFKEVMGKFEGIIPVEQAYYVLLYTDYSEDDIIPLKEKSAE